MDYPASLQNLFAQVSAYLRVHYQEYGIAESGQTTGFGASVLRETAPVLHGTGFPQEALSKYAGNRRSLGNLDSLLRELDETFSEAVLRITRERGWKEADVYKQAGLDRKLFSKLRSNPDYVPKKSTALALCIGLRLTLEEALDLLGRAGYWLSPASKSDVIIRYFLENRDCDLDAVNTVLHHFGQPVLGSGGQELPV